MRELNGDAVQPAVTAKQTLADWLQWQQGLHSQEIDLGLERVRLVAERMALLQPACPVITVGGTNGKGSCIAYLEAILQNAGYRVGVYTSPHMLRYNERVRIAGQEVEDALLVEAFQRIDAARGELSLTYFEFGTLAAFDLFTRADCDCWLLEVGLGGRLDAVNVLAADVAVLTSISLDHTDWLGSDRDSVAFEKAGIFRPARPAIYAEQDIPASIVREAERVGTTLYHVGRDYDFSQHADTWSFQGPNDAWDDLPAPSLPGEHQYANAAAGLAALQLLADRLPVPLAAVRRGLTEAILPGRLQKLPGALEWILDVAHNEASVNVLAEYLAQQPIQGRCHAVFAQMQRKELEPVLQRMASLVDVWWLLQLPDGDARAAAEVASSMQRQGLLIGAQDRADHLFEAVAAAAKPGDRVIVFGSFRTVEEALRYHERVSEGG